jgi:hypothetical protein
VPERRAGDKLLRVNPDEQWLLNQGFMVEVEQVESDLFWAHLVYRGNPFPWGRVSKYGRGETAAKSIERARRRFQEEQLGE